jgi:radical SAM superfamily enzyme YgiQ (UPF0313 family)
MLPGQKPNYGLQPLGILHIGSMLLANGIDVEILDADIDGLTIDETAEAILAAEPDLVGFSIMTPQLMSALDVCAVLKKARPSLPIVLGGAQISSTLEEVFSLSDAFDFAVYGEGEPTMKDVCERIEHGFSPELLRDIPGVIYRDAAGNVVKNSPRQFIADLDSLPRIDYDLLDITKYKIPTMVGRHVISMVITRGCPFNCIFCDAPVTMGRKLRLRSPEQIVEEIEFNQQKYGVKSFVFKDSTFTANKKWVREFCDGIIRSGLDIKWRCNARVDTVNDELLEIMKRAGCFIINFGVESGHPQILKNIGKEFHIDDICEAHRLTRKHGIRTYSTFLVGSPGETEETIRATIRLAKKIRPSLAMFFVAVAYPGTAMYERAVEEGVVEPRWWANRDWGSQDHTNFEKRWGWTNRGGLKIPGFDAARWQKRATRSFYFRPRFMWDTAIFTLKNPSFFRHLIRLGSELIPFYKIPLPWKKPGRNRGQDSLSKCPSAPTINYARRVDVPCDSE